MPLLNKSPTLSRLSNLLFHPRSTLLAPTARKVNTNAIQESDSRQFQKERATHAFSLLSCLVGENPAAWAWPVSNNPISATELIMVLQISIVYAKRTESVEYDETCQTGYCYVPRDVMMIQCKMVLLGKAVPPRFWRSNTWGLRQIEM